MTTTVLSASGLVRARVTPLTDGVRVVIMRLDKQSLIGDRVFYRPFHEVLDATYAQLHHA